MRSGKAILAGAVAAVALAGGGAAVLAAGDGDDGGGEPRLGTSSVAVEPPTTEQQPTPTPEPEPAPRAEVEPPAEPESQPAPEAGAKPRETRFPREPHKRPAKTRKRFAVPPAQEFSGRGDALIGTVDVKATAVVKWRAHGRFGLEFGPEAFPIVAPSRRGELVIPPFRFEQVRVMAKGRWRIVITPQR